MFFVSFALVMSLDYVLLVCFGVLCLDYVLLVCFGVLCLDYVLLVSVLVAVLGSSYLGLCYS